MNSVKRSLVGGARELEEAEACALISLAGQPLLLKKKEGLVNEPTSTCHCGM